jgi:protein TonB
MSVATTASSRPAFARLAAGVVLICVIAGCRQEQPAGDATQPAAAPAATAPAEQPAPAIAAEVAALGVDELRAKARAAYAESRLYAPAGDNAMEYYLALRDKAPGDAAVSSALTDLMPMVVIATEQSRDREDFVEAKRLSSLIAKADANHPALARLGASIASAEEAVAEQAAQQALTAEQEAERQAQLQTERQQQQQEQQAQAAQQLAAQQAEQQAAAQREAQAAAQRSAQQQAAPPPAPAAPTPPPAAAPTLRALSTPAPAYPPEALRSGRAGEVQVEFTVNPDGSVADARVIRADPPRVFDRAALNAVRRWRFEPVAAPVTTRRTIGFTPGN